MASPGPARRSGAVIVAGILRRPATAVEPRRTEAGVLHGLFIQSVGEALALVSRVLRKVAAAPALDGAGAKFREPVRLDRRAGLLHQRLIVVEVHLGQQDGAEH